MCFGNLETTGQTQGLSNSNQNTNFSQTRQIDPALRDYATSNLDYLNSVRSSGYPSYPDQSALVAPLSNDQGMVAQQYRDMAASAYLPEIAESEDRLRQYADAPYQPVAANHVTTWNVMAENGPVGSISGYMSPYTDKVLEPQLQDINEEGFRREKQNNAQAAMAGAFGDTGWGFAREREQDLTDRRRLAAISNENQNAWDRAMALREQDLARILDSDKFNVTNDLDAAKFNSNSYERMLERRRAGANDLARAGIMNSQNRMAVLSALDRAGQAQQANDQQQANIAYQEFSRATGYPLEVSAMILNAINGSPLTGAGSVSGTSQTAGTGTSTNTTQAPNNSGFQILGSLLGAFL